MSCVVGWFLPWQISQRICTTHDEIEQIDARRYAINYRLGRQYTVTVICQAQRFEHTIRSQVRMFSDSRPVYIHMGVQIIVQHTWNVC